MKIEYKLLERSNGDRALVRVKRGLLTSRTEYFYLLINEWTEQPNWYDKNFDKLDSAFDFHCNSGEVKFLKSCGGK